MSVRSKLTPSVINIHSSISYPNYSQDNSKNSWGTDDSKLPFGEDISEAIFILAGTDATLRVRFRADNCHDVQNLKLQYRDPLLSMIISAMENDEHNSERVANALIAYVYLSQTFQMSRSIDKYKNCSFIIVGRMLSIDEQQKMARSGQPSKMWARHGIVTSLQRAQTMLDDGFLVKMATDYILEQIHRDPAFA